MLDPFAFLTDFILEPSRDGMVMARRMAIRLTTEHRAPDAAAELQERLVASLEAALAARHDDGHTYFDRQQDARRILMECKARVLQ